MSTGSSGTTGALLAREKIGRTALTMQMAVCAAAGKDFITFKNMHPDKQYVDKFVELYEHIDHPSYVSRFEQASVQQGHPTQVTNLIMGFGQVDPTGQTGDRGDCSTVSGQTPVVTIDSAAWANLDTGIASGFTCSSSRRRSTQG